MAIAFRSAAGDDFTTTTGPTVTMPSGVQDDDIVLVAFATATLANYSGTPPTNWTKIIEQDSAGNTSTTAVFWTRAASLGSTVTFTSITDANEAGRVVSLAYSGCKTTGDPQDATATGVDIGNTGDGRKDTTALTPATDGAIVIAFIGFDPTADPTTNTWDGGITERIDSNTTPSGQNASIGAVFVGDKIVATPVSTSLGCTLSATNTSAAVIAVCLAPAGAAAAVIPSLVMAPVRSA